MESSNPVLSDKLIKKISKELDATDHMTVGGSLAKTGFLFAIVLTVGAWAWNMTSNNPSAAGSWVLGSSIIGFVLALAIIFWRPNPALTALYAGAQGVLLGSISFLFNADMQGIVLQAITLTIGVTLSMFALYATGLITVTEKLRSTILIATLGVVFFYLITFIIGLFSSSFLDVVYSGTTGVVFSAIIVIIAALNLLLDFDFIERGSEKKLPKQFEWYAGFGLMVTLIWLYISILRLLAASRN